VNSTLPNKKYLKITEWLIYLSIGFFCLSYSVFHSIFAELHVNLAFLDFPVFVGEILLAFCIALSIIRWKMMGFQFKPFYFILGLYIVWLLVKSFSGYFAYGPLAFRNAALYYYPLFGVIAYEIYKGEFFTKGIVLFLFFTFILVNTQFEIFRYYLLPYFMLSCVLALNIEKKWSRIALFGLLLLVFPLHKNFIGGKAFIISNIIAFFFLLNCLFFNFLKVKPRFKLGFIFLLSVALTLGFFMYSNKSQVASLTTPGRFIEEYKKVDAFINEKSEHYKPKILSISLYNDTKINLTQSLHNRSGKLSSAKEIRELIYKTTDVDIVAKEMGKILKYKFEHIKHDVSYRIRLNREYLQLAINTNSDDVNEQTEKIAELKKITEDLLRKIKNTFDKKGEVFLDEFAASLYEKDKYDPDVIEKIAFNAVYDLDKFEDKVVSEAIEFWETKQAIVKSGEEVRNSSPPIDFSKFDRLYNQKFPNSEESVLSEGAGKHFSQDNVATSMNEKKMIENKGEVNKEGNFEDEKQQIIEPVIDVINLVEEEIALNLTQGWGRTGKGAKYDEKILELANEEVILSQAGRYDEGLRTLEAEYSNMFFRILIWRDMIKEIISENAWMGINFGKPQRSISLEILGQAYGEWMRDGWITPHNSFLHIVYRAGILGMIYIITIFGVFISMVKNFIRSKSMKGILICTILIYWFSMANFLVFLELPYEAIPFWCLFGMAFAYSHEHKNKVSTAKMQ